MELLNRYLRNLAAQHRAKGIATTFVVVDVERPSQILGYYALGAATIEPEKLTDDDGKGFSAYPIPAVRIGRLATSLAARGQGVGELMLQNAVKRVLQARSMLGVYGIVVAAKDAKEEAFYRRYGFRLTDATSRQLYLPLGAG